MKAPKKFSGSMIIFETFGSYQNIQYSKVWFHSV